MKAAIQRKVFHHKKKRNAANGFSMTELIVVLAIMSVLTAISVPYIYNYKKLYKAEDQALKIMDLLSETSQLALTKRRTMRFELDTTANLALIIDENQPGPSDDKVIKAIPLEPVSEVRFDDSPTGVSKPNPPNYNNAVFASDTIGHLHNGSTVIGNRVWAARFKSNGSVVKADNSVISATIYVWAPLTSGSSTARNKKEVRAITVFGGSGAVRFWKHDGTTFQPF